MERAHTPRAATRQLTTTAERGGTAADLVENGVSVYLRLVLEHRSVPHRLSANRARLSRRPELTEARERALSRFQAKVQRVADAARSARRRCKTQRRRSTPCARVSQTPSYGVRACACSLRAKRNVPGATRSRRWSEASTRARPPPTAEASGGTRTGLSRRRSRGSSPVAPVFLAAPDTPE